MSISVHSPSANRVKRPSSTVYCSLIAGAVLLAVIMGVIHGDPGAANGTSVGMIVP